MTSNRKTPSLDDVRQFFEHPKLTSVELYTKSSPDPDVPPFRVLRLHLKAHRLRHRFGHKGSEQ